MFKLNELYFDDRSRWYKKIKWRFDDDQFLFWNFDFDKNNWSFKFLDFQEYFINLVYFIKLKYKRVKTHPYYQSKI